MKKMFLILIIIFELTVIKIPKYVELNNLAIIEEIFIEEKNNQYTLVLKEVIPLKGDQGITYEYDYHKSTASSLEKAYKKIKTNAKKKLYLSKAKSLTTNSKSIDKIITNLKIKPKNIIHTNKVLPKQINKYST